MKMLMGMTRGQVFEVVFWATFAIAAYVLTFSFDQEVSGYQFGAAMWPRGILVLILTSICFQLYQDLREGQTNTKDKSADDDEAPVRNWPKVIASLTLPLIYATLLESVGFYCMTPFFIALFLYIGGERRWSRIISVSIFIYVLIVFLFTTLLYVGLPTGTISPFYEISNWLVPLIR